MSSRRIFVAIPLTENIKQGPEAVKEKNAALQKLVWTKPHNLHITIYFIGNAVSEKVPEIGRRVHYAVSSCKPFGLEIEKISLEPSGHKPVMIWLRFYRNETFTRLSAHIHELLKEFTGNNPFYFREPVPHITLARFNSNFNTKRIVLPRIIMPEIRITRCGLYESIPTPQGVKYEYIKNFNFKAS